MNPLITNNRMESFFRAVRNEFELNQHFEEDLLDQVRLMGCRVSVCNRDQTKEIFLLTADSPKGLL